MNAAGQVGASYTYDAFGNLLQQSGTAGNGYQYQTKQTSSTTGLVYFGARYYNPLVGRWMTQDPAGMIDGPNRYLYCLNNPINWVDPLGLDTYYVNYELGSSSPSPTSNSISHSYVATTNYGIVTDTYSWGNNGESRWFHNEPIDLAVAQHAINSEVGIKWYGGEDWDQYVDAQFYKRQKNISSYNFVLNNCKKNAADLLHDAKKQLQKEMRLKQKDKECKQ